MPPEIAAAPAAAENTATTSAPGSSSSPAAQTAAAPPPGTVPSPGPGGTAIDPAAQGGISPDDRLADEISERIALPGDDPLGGKKIPIKVNGETRELGYAEIRDIVNKSDYGERAAERMKAAAAAEKKNVERETTVRGVLESLTAGKDARSVLEELFLGRYGDAELAEQRLLELGKAIVMPHVELSKLSPQEREARLQAQRRERELERREREIERHRAEDEARMRQAEEESERSRRGEYLKKVIDKMAAEGIPNDPISLSIFQFAEKDAAEKGYELTPHLATKIIQRQRKRLLESSGAAQGANPVHLPPVQPAKPQTAEPESRNKRMVSMEAWMRGIRAGR